MMLQEHKIDFILEDNLMQRVKIEDNLHRVDAAGLHYKDLNSILKTLCGSGARKIEISNVCGQRYIGTGLNCPVQIDIYGTPGNDLGAFMNGPKITVHGNVQDACGNTMNEGSIVVHGCSGDLTANSMRGGKIFIRDDVGYRVGIHMKEYQNKKPVLVVGGIAQDFFCEYMAGGVALVLGLNRQQDEKCVARFVGMGMHGGTLYTRGDIFKLSEGAKIAKAGKRDMRIIECLVKDYCSNFGKKVAEVMDKQFYKITPFSKRPYEKLYSR